MRVTNQTYQNNFLYDLNNNNNRMATLQQQIGTGEIAQRPSDAPTIVSRSLTFSVQLNQTDINAQNINSGVSWLDASDNSIQTIDSMLTTIQEKVTQAANGTYGASDVYAIGLNIQKMTQQIINTMNSNVGDRYLFAGTCDNTAPFSTDGTYNGDQGNIFMPVQGGVVNPEDPVNVTGTDVMGSTQYTSIDINGKTIPITDSSGNQLTSLQGDANNKIPQTLKLLNAIGELMTRNNGQDWVNAKSSGTVNNADDWLKTNAISVVQASMSTTKNCLAQIGATGEAYLMSKSMNYNMSLVIQQEDSINSDVDAAKAAIYLKSAETTYQASMAVGAKLMPNSLVDYLS